MDTQELTREIMKRHHVGLKPDDPIFITLTLNDLLIANYLEQFKAMMEQQGKQQEVFAEKFAQSQVERFENRCNQLLGSLHHELEQNKRELDEAFQAQIEAIRKEKASCVSLFNAAAQTMIKYAYLIVLLGGILIGFIGRGFVR